MTLGRLLLEIQELALQREELMVKNQKSDKHKLLRFITSGFYSGLLPHMPGTWGSALAVALAFLLISSFPSASQLLASISLSLLVCIIGIITADRACKLEIYGPSRKDPQEIVIDEFAGIFISTIGVGVSAGNFVLCFILFRLFDITKPQPVRALERVPGAWGIMLDDMIAGLYANLTLQLLNWIFT